MSEVETFKLTLEFSNENDLEEVYHKVMYLLRSGIVKVNDKVGIVITNQRCV